MSNKQQPSAVVVVAIATVIVAVIGSVTLITITAEKSQIPEGWIGILAGILGTLVTAIVGLVRTEQANTKLDQVLNGKMDAKIEGGVHRAMDEREARSSEEPGKHKAE